MANPYHDEEGKFTSRDKQGQKNPQNNTGYEKIISALGLKPNNNFHYEKNDIQKIVPQTNRDGSKRIFVNNLSIQERNARLLNERQNDIKPNKKIEETIKINTPERQAFREQTVENEIKKQMSEGEKKFDREATVVFGLPGSGKSTLTKMLDNNGSFIIDSDIFTEQIPEFKEDSTLLGGVVHEAGSMNSDMRKKIIEKGGNMIINKVGNGIDIRYLENIFDELYDNGYKVKLILNDIPFEEALRRNKQRHAEGNPRLVPASVLFNGDATIYNNFGKLLNHPSVVNGAIYSNDVEKGEMPKLIKEFNKVE